MYSPTEVCQKVKIGMTRDEVKATLGEPDDISIGTRKYPRPCVWKYGTVELHFYYPTNGGLWLVGLFEDPHHHEILMIDPEYKRANLDPV